MDRDFIDRRPRASSAGAATVDLDAEDAPGFSRRDAWDWLGIGIEPEGDGSPELADHQRAVMLIEAAVRRYSEAEVRSRRPRDGHQRHGARNLGIYLLSAVLGLSDAELARMGLGLDNRKSVRSARLRGGRLAPVAFARSRTDPRRPGNPETRPVGRNEARW